MDGLKRARSDGDVGNLDDGRTPNLSSKQVIASIEMMSQEDAEAVFEAARKRVNGFRMEKHQMMLRAFQKGDKVFFYNKLGKMVWGTVKSVNAKSVSVHECSDGQKWRVSPGLLQFDRVAQNRDLLE